MKVLCRYGCVSLGRGDNVTGINIVVFADTEYRMGCVSTRLIHCLMSVRYEMSIKYIECDIHTSKKKVVYAIERVGI